MRKQFVVTDEYPKGSADSWGLKKGDVFTIDFGKPKEKPMHVWVIEGRTIFGWQQFTLAHREMTLSGIECFYNVLCYKTRTEARNEMHRMRVKVAGKLRVRKYVRV